MRQVDAGFGCELEPALGLRLQSAIDEEGVAILGTLRSDPAQVAEQFLELGEAPVERVTIDQRCPPPAGGVALAGGSRPSATRRRRARACER